MCVFIQENTFSIDVDIIGTALEIPHFPKPSYPFRNDPVKDVVLSWFGDLRVVKGTGANA